MNDAGAFATPAVNVDHGEIERYFSVMLSRAGGLSGFISFRRFKLGPGSEVRISATEWTGNIGPVVNQAEQVAQRAATEPPDGFCCATAIPGALFRDKERARQSDITALLAICIDCDDAPMATHTTVLGALGDPTLTTFSGGEWINPANGTSERKQHLLYVFEKPVTDPAEIGRVWVAYRQLLRVIRVGGLKGADRSSTAVHPYRYAGCVWRKNKAAPRLVQIAKTTDRTITIDEFLAAVERLSPGPAPVAQPAAAQRPAGPGLQTEGASDTDLIAAIVEGRELHDSLTKLAWRMVSRETNPEASRGLLVAELRKVMHRSARKQSDHDVWKSRYDDLDRLVGDAIAKQLAERATIPADPLTAKLAPQEVYPVDKLPLGFRQAVEATARVSEVAVSMTSTIALAAATTSVAKLVPGVLIDGRLVPLSLFALVIAGSSERKSTLDALLFAGIRLIEANELMQAYRDAMRHHNAQLAAWERMRREILGRRGLDRTERVRMLEALDEPIAPPLPNITTAEATVEGLRDALAGGYGLLALLTAEGGTLLAGHSLGSREKRTAGAGFLSGAWDGRDLPVLRAGRSILVKAPRLSMSIGVQPRIAGAFLGDLDMRDQGIVNRLLCCWAEERAGTRTLAQPDQQDLDAVATFNEVCADRLRDVFGIGAGAFSPRRDKPLELADDALKAWRAFAVEMERQQARGGRFEDAKGWASKTAEQALRIAGALALFEDPAAAEISLDMLDAGTAVAEWHCNEFRRITQIEQPEPRAERAEKVLHWLRRQFGRKGDSFTARDIYRAGVAGLGTRDPTVAVLNVLRDRGYIRDKGPPLGSVAGRHPLPPYELVSNTIRSASGQS